VTGSRPQDCFSAQRFGHCRSAFFAGIPRVQNGVGMFVDPVDGQGTAVHENHGERLAGGCHGFDQVFFRLGKIDAGAISAEESRFAHRHFFAFELARNAHDGDHNIGILCRGNGLWRRRIVVPGPDQFRMGLAVLLP
jgi:hypothetical protein